MDGLIAIIMLTLFVAGYFFPAIVASARKVPNAGSVAVINTFLGWTLVGWVVALAMAMRSVPAQPAAPHYGFAAPTAGRPPFGPGPAVGPTNGRGDRAVR